jgi:hypothetical protein
VWVKIDQASFRTAFGPTHPRDDGGRQRGPERPRRALRVRLVVVLRWPMELLRVQVEDVRVGGGKQEEGRTGESGSATRGVVKDWACCLVWRLEHPCCPCCWSVWVGWVGFMSEEGEHA